MDVNEEEFVFYNTKDIKVTSQRIISASNEYDLDCIEDVVINAVDQGNVWYFGILGLIALVLTGAWVLLWWVLFFIGTALGQGGFGSGTVLGILSTAPAFPMVVSGLSAVPFIIGMSYCISGRIRKQVYILVLKTKDDSDSAIELLKTDDVAKVFVLRSAARIAFRIHQIDEE